MPADFLLQLRNVRFAYSRHGGPRTLVLDVPYFALAAGEQVAVKGESGSGKTTLLNVIAGMLTPEAGEVCFEGSDIARLPGWQRDRLRAGKIGMVYQSFHLLKAFTALENVLLGMQMAGLVNPERARQLLVRLGLEKRLDYFPSQLSIGQRQRVALARALANHPRLVLADEPTGNLDRSSAAEALGLLRQLCEEQNAALLLVSHDPWVLESFPRLLALEEINRAGAAA